VEASVRFGMGAAAVAIAAAAFVGAALAVPFTMKAISASIAEGIPPVSTDDVALGAVPPTGLPRSLSVTAEPDSSSATVEPSAAATSAAGVRRRIYEYMQRYRNPDGTYDVARMHRDMRSGKFDPPVGGSGSGSPDAPGGSAAGAGPSRDATSVFW
jgi:hypothetical protein